MSIFLWLNLAPCPLPIAPDLVYEGIVLHDKDRKQKTENDYGNEVPERHRLPEREEGEDVVWQVPDLRTRFKWEGGPKAPQRPDLPQGGQSEVEGRAVVARDDPKRMRGTH